MHESPARTARTFSRTDFALVVATIAVAAMLFGASPGLVLILAATATLVLDILAPQILDAILISRRRC